MRERPINLPGTPTLLQSLLLLIILQYVEVQYKYRQRVTHYKCGSKYCKCEIFHYTVLVIFKFTNIIGFYKFGGARSPPPPRPAA